MLFTGCAMFNQYILINISIHFWKNLPRKILFCKAKEWICFIVLVHKQLFYENELFYKKKEKSNGSLWDVPVRKKESKI